MRLIFLILLTLLSLSTAAQAGAWLRERGEGFVSLSFGATRFDETKNALYIEYGLTDAQDVRNGFGNLFARRALGPTDRPHRFAYEIGLGGLWGNEMQLPTVKTGVSWGYGFSHASGNGWMSLDAAYVYEPRMGNHIAKIDGTLGVDFSTLTTGLIEFTLSEQNDDAYGAVEPSLLFRPRGSSFNVKIGAEIPYKETEKSALKLGLWHRF
ncbi:hypothetical protein AB2B41_16170 [Marimonas sp. MJW-29]|uniref:Outer membrane protein beta-barrel domain-containing protein n=1 Tax=Sulfitobacter sediminis TaxID=3234186 RepID=A0ABV3RSX0_9RHOB